MKVLIFLITFYSVYRNSVCDTLNESCSTDGCPNILDDDLQNFEQEDPRLIEIVKKRFVIPPPKPVWQVS